jgi:hypothetical protein
MERAAVADMMNQDLLIDRLSQGLQPVRRPLPAWLRALGWAALAVPCGVAVSRLVPHYVPDWSRPEMVWAMVEIALSLTVGLTAVMLAFGISIAGRPMRGGRLLVALGLVWLAVCAANIAVSPWHAVHVGAGTYCYSFMMLASAPMMALVILALRRTRALRPGRALAVAGTGIAFIVSGLLGFCHPGLLHPVDFLMHLAAGGTIVILTSLLGRRFVSA